MSFFIFLFAINKLHYQIKCYLSYSNTLKEFTVVTSILLSNCKFEFENITHPNEPFFEALFTFLLYKHNRNVRIQFNQHQTCSYKKHITKKTRMFAKCSTQWGHHKICRTYIINKTQNSHKINKSHDNTKFREINDWGNGLLMIFPLRSKFVLKSWQCVVRSNFCNWAAIYRAGRLLFLKLVVNQNY